MNNTYYEGSFCYWLLKKGLRISPSKSVSSKPYVLYSYFLYMLLDLSVCLSIYDYILVYREWYIGVQIIEFLIIATCPVELLNHEINPRGFPLVTENTLFLETLHLEG